MFKSLKNLFFKNSSNIELEDISVEETEEEKFQKKSLDEKAIIVSELFAEKMKNQYDFDYVDITIEDQKDIKYKSAVFQLLAKFGFLSEIKDEFSFDKYILENGFISKNEKKVVIFSIYRKYSDMYENKIMIGSIFEDGNIIFYENLNKGIFEHFKWDGKFKLAASMEYFYNNSYYFYDYRQNKLLYNTDIILDNKFNSLYLREKINKSYFPPRRTYLLSFSLEIDKQHESYQTVSTLKYKEEVLRTLEFNILYNGSLYKAVNRMLFPYNLELDRLKELRLENLDIKDIKNLFEDEFKIYNIIEV